MYKYIQGANIIVYLYKSANKDFITAIKFIIYEKIFYF